MSLPPEVAEELLRLGESEALRRDLAALRAARAARPTEGDRAAEGAVEFLLQYNAFVNHAPKPFRPIPDGDMRL